MFDQNGKFVREIGKGVYGLGYAHSVRFDKYDNLWVVDKGVNTVVKFNPAWYVTLNLGRRPEGPDDPEEFWYRPAAAARMRPPPVTSMANSGRRPTSRSTRTTTSTSATAIRIRGSPNSTSAGIG